MKKNKTKILISSSSDSSKILKDTLSSRGFTVRLEDIPVDRLSRTITKKEADILILPYDFEIENLHTLQQSGSIPVLLQTESREKALEMIYDNNADNGYVHHTFSEIEMAFAIQNVQNKSKLKKLVESEERYRALFEGAGEGILIADIESKKFLYANPAISKMLKYSVSELKEMTVDDIHPKEELAYVIKEFEAQSRGEKILTTEIPCLTKDGSVIYADILTTKMKIDNKQCNVGFFTDITERKNTQDQIKRYLNEKETLLKEIHHRVKNNLQIITSLLDLQLSSIKDKKTKNIFINSINRIYSMSLVHEMLYQSEEMSAIDFNNYITSLTKALQQSLAGDNQEITFSLQIDSINLPLNKAIPCGLIVNELVSNALKHAFIDKPHGTISLNFSCKNGKNNLTIRDDGNGFPPNFDIKKTTSLGLMLVRELTRQLKGELAISNKPGACFEIIFLS